MSGLCLLGRGSGQGILSCAVRRKSPASQGNDCLPCRIGDLSPPPADGRSASSLGGHAEILSTLGRLRSLIVLARPPMYLRSTPRRNKDGSEVRYLQLAHNVWDPQLRRSKVQVVYNFGREDATSRDALERPVASATPAPRPRRRAGRHDRRAGVHRVQAARRHLGAGRAVVPARHRPGDAQAAEGRRLDDSAERVLFALVANRALAPSSKLSAARWASGDVLITGLPATSDDACYRAMDWLLEIRDELEKQVFDNLADLLNLEMDLLFFDYPANQVRDLALAA